MNFKFTLWKSIASIVGGIILGYLSEGLLMRSPTCELGATSCPPVTDYSLIFMGGFILLIYLLFWAKKIVLIFLSIFQNLKLNPKGRCLRQKLNSTIKPYPAATFYVPATLK